MNSYETTTAIDQILKNVTDNLLTVENYLMTEKYVLTDEQSDNLAEIGRIVSNLKHIDIRNSINN